MTERRASFLRRVRHDQGGQVLIFVAVGLVSLIGMIAFVTDIGYVLGSRRALQASTDAAAAAGAMDIGETGMDPVATATAFSSKAGSKNARPNLPNVSITASVKCTNFMAQLMTGANCTNATTPPNTMVVTQTSVIPMYFANILGIHTMSVTATATAAMRGGVMPPLDLMIVLDTTGSMSDNCSATIPGISSPDRLDCAKAGVRALLSALWPCSQSLSNCGAASGGNYSNPIDKAGMIIFPGLTSGAAVSQEYDCASNVSSAEIADYNASPNYLIVPLSSDYRTSTTSGLNGASSNLVKSVDWADGNTCSSGSYGLERPGGVGSFFSGAINAAQSTLVSSGRANVQNVIVFVSDGDATSSTGGSNPCHSAITAAQAATAAGTWVYSVAYGASTSSGCAVDSPSISAYSTMQQIASSSTMFFSQPAAGDLTAIFTKIGQNLLNTRLLDDATP